MTTPLTSKRKHPFITPNKNKGEFLPYADILKLAGFQEDELNAVSQGGHEISYIFAKALRVYTKKHNMSLEQIANRINSHITDNFYGLIFDLQHDSSVEEIFPEYYVKRDFYSAKYLLNTIKPDALFPLNATHFYTVVDFPDLDLTSLSPVLLNNLALFYNSFRDQKSQAGEQYLSPDWEEIKHKMFNAVATLGPKKFYDFANSKIPIEMWEDLKDAPVEWLLGLNSDETPDNDEED